MHALAGCTENTSSPTPSDATAGGTTLTVSSTADGLRIVSEKENTASGASADLSVALQPGEYFTACKPGMRGANIGQAAFTALPKMVNDFLDPAISRGDVCIQACSNDPQVAVHAIRNLTRLAFGRAQIRWSQLGFGRTSSTSTKQQTPRNLFGLKDGTANLKLEEPEYLKTTGSSVFLVLPGTADGQYIGQQLFDA